LIGKMMFSRRVVRLARLSADFLLIRSWIGLDVDERRTSGAASAAALGRNGF
jgi:hypothetical protein